MHSPEIDILSAYLNRHISLWEQTIPDLLIHFEQVNLEVNEYLPCQRGDIYFVCKGYLGQYRKNQPIAYFQVGHPILLSLQNSPAPLKALTDSTILMLRRETTYLLNEKYTGTFELYQQLSVLHEKIIKFKDELRSIPKMQRLAAFRQEYKAIIPLISRKELAQFLGISREYLRRQY